MENGQSNDIASYFEKYPDIPKEVILKEDICRLGLRFTESFSLRPPKDAGKRSISSFHGTVLPSKGWKNRRVLRVSPNDIRFRGGPWNIEPIVTRVPINPQSPYTVDVVDGKLALLENGVPIAETEYPPRPKYYNMKFDDGTLYRDIAPVSDGGATLFAQVSPACQFWGSKEEVRIL